MAVKIYNQRRTVSGIKTSYTFEEITKTHPSAA